MTQLVKLGDVAEFIRGITFKPKDVVSSDTGGSVRCMRTKNVQDSVDLSDVWSVDARFVKRSSQYLRAGDILVSSANSWNLVGKCTWVPELSWPATFGGFVSVLRARPSQVYARYLYRWFSSPRTQATLRSFGRQTTSISNLDLKRALNMELLLPDFAEQQRIVDTLDQTDMLLAKRRQALSFLDELAKSVFLDMFGDIHNNDMAVLGDYLTFVTSGGRGWAKYYSDSGSRFIRSLDVRMNEIEDRSAVYVTPPNNAEAIRTRVHSGDVLLTITGSLIGRVAPVSPHLEGSYVSQHVAILRPEASRLDSGFLAFFLSIPSKGQRQIARLQYGQTKPGLNFEQIRKMRIPLPDISQQQLFARRLLAVGRIAESNRAHLEGLEQLANSIQHRAFRGEL
jgi:type I restriction enzyme, S subunit